jgi:signal transduction histidine kinase/tetratricopeptide (TPR) repeat protein
MRLDTGTWKSALVCLFALLALAGQPLYAENRADSLRIALNEQAEDSTKVKTLNALFATFIRSDPEQARGYAVRGYELSKTIGWENGTAKLANNLGVYYAQQGKYAQSLAYYDEVMAIFSRRKDSTMMANILCNIGGVYYRQSDLRQSMQYFERALSLYQAKHDTLGIAASVGNIATIQKDRGDYPKAQSALIYVLRLHERMHNYREVARAEMNIAGIFQLQNDPQNAKYWCLRSHHVADSIHDLFLVAAALNSLSELAIEDSSWATAKQFADSAMAISQVIGDDYAQACAQTNLARIAGGEGNNSLAEAYLVTALAIYQKINRKSGEANALEYLGAIQLKAGEAKTAVGTLEAALGIAEAIGLPLQRRTILLTLYKAYAATGDFERAFYAHLDYMALNDSIFSAKNFVEVTEVQSKYRSEEQQRVIQQLELSRAEDQLRIVSSRQRSYVLFAGIFLVLLTVIFLSLRIRQNRRTGLKIAIKNKEIAAQRDFAELQALRILQINASLEAIVATRTAAVLEAKRELDIFLYESAHALRRPVTRIMALVELSNQERDPAQLLQLRKRLGNTLQGMDDLLHKLIMVNESSRRAPVIAPINLAKLIDTCAFELDLPGKARFENMVAEELVIQADTYLLHSILISLLDNAASFFPDTPGHRIKVRVSATVEDNLWVIRIRDNGTGIASDQRDKIFDMFYRGTLRGSGQGLGLYIARKSAERMGGHVNWVAQEEEGTCFEIQIPRPTA